MNTRALKDRPKPGDDPEFRVLTELGPGVRLVCADVAGHGDRWYVQERRPFGWISCAAKDPDTGLRARPTAIEAMAAYDGKMWMRDDG